MNNNINGVYKAVEDQLSLLNQKLNGIANSEYELVNQIVLHIISSGKRVRPVLLFLIAKAFDVKNLNAIIDCAFAVELIHTASLLHDDVVDETKKRRGKKTANSIWGNKETILIGDYLFTESFTTMVKLNEMRAIEIIADASSKLTQGEITQLENERNIMLSVDEYLNIIYYKTASLFEASAKLGALFASDANIDLCAEFGKNLGFAFQIMDDILDYKGSLMMGKDAGNDFQEKKMTLPMIFLLNAVSASKREEIIRYFKNNGDFSFKEIQRLMQENGIFEKSQEFMNIFIKNASSFVNGLYNQEVKKLLMILIDFFIHRVL